ncbi:hypothetical protein WOLCODRAFT_154071 [Wolfiporia cocos MD-104 SS10]|uniref:Uncharacterized protein n=1 Tax=Wolfiporia cocos (strain MD-104) TaxID=742152 RepID=A0A2H3JR97_WOLCO|nr:hypothetical protein WOLCODRAFT_154071 [Wolfiporia cocos MD-104 SS10]
MQTQWHTEAIVATFGALNIGMRSEIWRLDSGRHEHGGAAVRSVPAFDERNAANMADLTVRGIITICAMSDMSRIAGNRSNATKSISPQARQRRLRTNGKHSSSQECGTPTIQQQQLHELEAGPYDMPISSPTDDLGSSGACTPPLPPALVLDAMVRRDILLTLTHALYNISVGVFPALYDAVAGAAAGDMVKNAVCALTAVRCVHLVQFRCLICAFALEAVFGTTRVRIPRLDHHTSTFGVCSESVRLYVRSPANRALEIDSRRRKTSTTGRLRDQGSSIPEEVSQKDMHVDDVTAQQTQRLVAEHKVTIKGPQDEQDGFSNDSQLPAARPASTGPPHGRSRGRLTRFMSPASVQEAAGAMIDGLEKELYDIRGKLGAGQRIDAAMARLQGENAAPLACLKELETSGAYRGSGGDPLALRAGVQQQVHRVARRRRGDLLRQFMCKRRGNGARMQLGECIPSIITCTFLESYKSVRRKQHAILVD